MHRLLRSLHKFPKTDKSSHVFFSLILQYLVLLSAVTWHLPYQSICSLHISENSNALTKNPSSLKYFISSNRVHLKALSCSELSCRASRSSKISFPAWPLWLRLCTCAFCNACGVVLCSYVIINIVRGSRLLCSCLRMLVCVCGLCFYDVLCLSKQSSCSHTANTLACLYLRFAKLKISLTIIVLNG